MKVGDYVRTEYGIARYIGDLVTFETNYRTIDKNIVYDNIEGWENVVTNDEIIKSRPNIIDLIEVGDYVNGYKVIGITEEYIDLQKSLDTQKVLLVLNGEVYEEAIKIREKDIKSIVTKEQFSCMEYKIGE